LPPGRERKSATKKSAQGKSKGRGLSSTDCFAKEDGVGKEMGRPYPLAAVTIPPAAKRRKKQGEKRRKKMRGKSFKGSGTEPRREGIFPKQDRGRGEKVG